MQFPLAHRETLRAAYHSGHLVVFVGAGVSISCGLPGWKQLADQVVDEAVPVDPRLGSPGHVRMPVEHYNRMYIKELPPIEAIRIVREKTGSLFSETVARALYKNEVTLSDTARGIASLAKVRRFCVFNYDSIIESALADRGRNCRPIVQGTPFSMMSDETLTFHVHGFLPDESLGMQRSEWIVFSEDDYHRLSAEPYQWANLVQLSLLLNYHVLFVGFSLTDPNTRRLLDLCKSSGSSHGHFALLQDPTLEIRRREAGSWFPSSGVARRISEQSLESRGVSPIWFDRYDEIPEILRLITDDVHEQNS